jgi:hypothetical protein
LWDSPPRGALEEKLAPLIGITDFDRVITTFQR